MDGQKEGRVIFLRIEPPFRAESQVAIRESKEGQSQVIYSELADKRQNQNLYTHITDLRSRDKRTSVEDAVRGIRVREKTVDSSPELQNALRALPEVSIPKNMRHSEFVDAVVYELWVESAEGEVHLLLLNQAPITDWIVKLEGLCQVAPGNSIIQEPLPK